MKVHREIPRPRTTRSLVALILFGTFPLASQASIKNGLFKNNLIPWTTTGSAVWQVDTPATGDGHVRLTQGSITQNGWQCGDDGPEVNSKCVLSFSYTSTLAVTQDALEVTFRSAGGAGPPLRLKGTGGQKVVFSLESLHCDLKDLTFSNVVFDGVVDIDNVTDNCVTLGAPAPPPMIAFGASACALLRRRMRKRTRS